MPYCQNCGKKISKDEDFCSECGKKTKIIVEKVVTKEKIVEKPVKEKSHLGYKISGFLIAVFGYLLWKGIQNQCWGDYKWGICVHREIFLLVSLVCILCGIILVIVGFSKR